MNDATHRRLIGLAIATIVLVAACSASTAAPASPAAKPTPGLDSSGPATSGGAGPARPADTGAPGGTSGDLDLCTVFTADRLAEVTGQAVTKGDQSDLFGMGCRWDTADGKGGVVYQRLPVRAGFGDIAAEDGQRPLAGFEGDATIGTAAFFDKSGDIHTGKLAAALVGDGFVSVIVVPAPSDDELVKLLHELVDATS
jgi:hypothetical protein